MQGSSDDAGGSAPPRAGGGDVVLISCGGQTARAVDEERETVPAVAQREVMRIVRYQRTLRAAAPDAFTAVAGAVDLLGYPLRGKNTESAEVRFSALARTVTAKVVDARPGHCTVVVEFASLRWLGSGGSALVILPGVLLGAAVKAHDAFFAKGFLENVRRVLEGKGVGRDPARIAWMNALCDKLDIAER